MNVWERFFSYTHIDAFIQQRRYNMNYHLLANRILFVTLLYISIIVIL